MVVFVMLIIALVAVGVAVLWGLRRWTLDEVGLEARLRLPETHKLTYSVPLGQDPATYVAALAHAGFTSVGALESGAEWLLVACNGEDRPKVRSIIEHVEAVGFEGSVVHSGHVSFEDEN